MTPEPEPLQLIECIYCEKKKNPEIHKYLLTINQRCNECDKILNPGPLFY